MLDVCWVLGVFNDLPLMSDSVPEPELAAELLSISMFPVITRSPSSSLATPLAVLLLFGGSTVNEIEFLA